MPRRDKSVAKRSTESAIAEESSLSMLSISLSNCSRRDRREEEGGSLNATLNEQWEEESGRQGESITETSVKRLNTSANS